MRWNTPAVRVVLVVNPSASRVTPRRQRLVESILRADHEVRVVRTTRRDDATDLARTAAGDDAECVVVLGGDGTLNEAVTALAGTGCALACLPGGSTNIFSRTIGLPDDLAEATRRVSKALSDGTFRRVGVGSVNGRYFLLHSGVGWDAELVSIVERHAHLKRRIGHLLFAYAGVRAFFATYDRTRPHFEVHARTADGCEALGDGYFALVMNSDPYTYVHTRPFVVAPETTPERPLTLVVVRSMRFTHFGGLVIEALRDRSGIRSSPWVTVRSGIDGVTITRLRTDPPPALPYHVDGDHLGEEQELRYLHHPEALTVVAPLTATAVRRGRSRGRW